MPSWNIIHPTPPQPFRSLDIIARKMKNFFTTAVRVLLMSLCRWFRCSVNRMKWDEASASSERVLLLIVIVNSNQNKRLLFVRVLRMILHIRLPSAIFSHRLLKLSRLACLHRLPWPSIFLNWDFIKLFFLELYRSLTVSLLRAIHLIVPFSVCCDFLCCLLCLHLIVPIVDRFSNNQCRLLCFPIWAA